MLLPQNIKPDSDGIHPREREHQAIYRAYTFGQFRLFCNNKLTKESMWRRNKAKALLKWFLLNPNKLYSADQLIDLFWPNLPLETAFCNLHVTIHCLRRLLEPSLTSRQESKFIRRQSSNFYWFNMDNSWWTDIVDVQHLFESARASDACNSDVKASFYYRKIASYCSLGFLLDDTEEWLAPYRHRYEYIYSQTLVRLIHIYQQRNEIEEMLEYAYQALSLDPYCEPAITAIVDSCLKRGDISEAMHKLDAFGNVLRRELGLEPGKELQALRRRITAASD